MRLTLMNNHLVLREYRQVLNEVGHTSLRLAGVEPMQKDHAADREAVHVAGNASDLNNISELHGTSRCN